MDQSVAEIVIGEAESLLARVPVDLNAFTSCNCHKRIGEAHEVLDVDSESEDHRKELWKMKQGVVKNRQLMRI
jgi:hypothetical protein